MKLYEVTGTVYVLARSPLHAESIFQHESIDFGPDDVDAFEATDVPDDWLDSLPWVDTGYDPPLPERTCAVILAEQRARETERAVYEAAMSKQIGMVLPEEPE